MIDRRSLALAGYHFAPLPAPAPFPMYRDGRVVAHGPAQYVGTFPLHIARSVVWDHDGATVTRDGDTGIVTIPA